MKFTLNKIIKMINDREIEIQKEEVFPSIIEKILPNQSFCSRSSSTSLNQFVTLLSRNNDENKTIKEPSRSDRINIAQKKQPKENLTIKQRWSTLLFEESKQQAINMKLSYNKNSALLNKLNRMKSIFQKDNTISSFQTAPNISNDNVLQRKAKKMLIGLKSKQFEVEADIEEFKSQLDNIDKHKKNPFGLKDFEMNFKKNLKRNNLIYQHFNIQNNTNTPKKFVKL